jgi:putative cardiolipin synthase
MKKSLLSLALCLCLNPIIADDNPHFFVNDVNVTGKDNKMQLLNSGLASFQKRIDLVRKAKERISIEYFIWEKDKAGLLLFHELIKKAKEGVKVRIILDKSITVVEMDEYIAEALKSYGIELRHYNRAMDPMTAQLRTHRKILVIDGKEGITGGRNIGDDYFDFDEVYNFLDRDVYFSGPGAKAMQDSFDDFWDASIVKLPKPVDSDVTARRINRGDRRNRDRYNKVRGKRNDELREQAKEWLANRDEMPAVAAEMEKIARPILDNTPILSCPKLTYVSDSPGAKALTLRRDDFLKEYRRLRRVLFDFIENKTKGDYILASPYFMLNEDWQKLLSGAIKNKDVNPIIFTNSLGSTDAFYVAANFYRIAFKWQAAGLDIWVHDSRYDELYPTLNSTVSSARWGMHEKTQLFSDEAFYIGTYNIDNRSDILNVEMGVFCEGSKELTALLKEDMQARYLKGYQFVGENEAIDKEGKKVDSYGNATSKQIKIMKGFSPLARLFEPLM